MPEKADPTKTTPTPKAATAPAAPAAAPISSGGGMSDVERDLRNANAALSQQNAELRAQVEAAGETVREPREASFGMSQGVRSDLIAAQAAVEHGDVKPEDVVVVDPASGKVYGIDDAPEPDESGM